jgi:hypothetical protein
MERKTSTVLLMMLSVLVIFALLVGVGFVLATDYEATVYDYEVSGQYSYEDSDGVKYIVPLSGTVSTTHMYIFGIERVSTVSDVHYKIGDVKKDYDLAAKWKFFSEPQIGELSHEIDDFSTTDYGIVPVNVYIQEDGNETITRYVGQEDGIIYKIERKIVTVTDNGDELITNIVQNLVSYEDTMMPIKL